MSAARLPERHPLRKVRGLVDALAVRGAFSGEVSPGGIPLEQLFCALLGGYLLGLRSEHHLAQELRLNDVYRRFVGLSTGSEPWPPSRLMADKRARFDTSAELKRRFQDVLKQAVAFKWVRLVMPEDRSRDHAEHDDAEIPLEVYIAPEHWLDGILGGDRRRRPRAEAPLDAPETLAEAARRASAPSRGFPSPEDWRDEVLYSVVLDRFARSGPGRPVGHPEDGTSRHGGNLRGLIERLDYIAGLGATAVHHTPATLTLPDAYHGYAPLHLLAVDPHLGTLADYKELVREAHARGMRVVPDLVLNHAGPVFEYEGSWQWEPSGKAVGRRLRPFLPRELDRPEHFSRRGVIVDWSDPEQSRGGDFPPDYRRLATENPETQDHLIAAARWWVAETDVDGFRLDAVRHMAPSFLARFSRELKGFAASRGKADFLILGENSTGLDAELAEFGCLDSLYDYPAYRRENLALHGREATRVLERSGREGDAAHGERRSRFVRFIDLHDTPRFLRAGEDEAVLRCALTYLFCSGGVPLVYYGTEQGFRQDADLLGDGDPDRLWDPRNREDMFVEGRYKSASSTGDRFLTGSEFYRWVSRLAALRREHPALRRGVTYARWSDPEGAGVFAFSRIHEGREVVVALNTAPEARRAGFRVDPSASPAGAHLRDLLGGSGASIEGREGESFVTVELPAHGAKVLCA